MFSKDDFYGDTANRLQVIIMRAVGKHPLFNFHSLMNHEKKRFNIKLNGYIASLPEDWEGKLLSDFHEACNEEILNEKFQPELFPPRLINTDIQLLPKEETI